MIPPAYIIVAMTKRAEGEPLWPELQQSDAAQRECVICHRRYALLHWVNGNGPYCSEHAASMHC